MKVKEVIQGSQTIRRSHDSYHPTADIPKCEKREIVKDKIRQ